MRTCAIICEYNPFHNGHKYQIQKIRALGITHVIAIMSSNFTQRGAPAVISKFPRAKSALLCGVDIVLELPTVFSTARAQDFAFAGVYIANALNCVDYLSFGCETCNIEILKTAAKASLNSLIENDLREKLSSGVTFAKARQEAIGLHFGTTIADVFSHSNNNLAVEYIKALNVLNSSIVPLPIKRYKASHFDNSFNGNFCSSSYIRENINSRKISKFMPKKSFEILKNELNDKKGPANISFAERAVLYKLKTMENKSFELLPDVSEGLGTKLYNEVKKSSSLNELYELVKTKRYTLARLQRIILSAYLNISKDDLSFKSPYIRVLGFNKKGSEILKTAKEKSILPIVTKYSDVKRLNNSDCLKFFEKETRFTELYSLMLPSINNCSNEKTSRIIKI